MWQYTSSGRVAGISGDVDLNLRFFRDGSKDDLTEVWKDRMAGRTPKRKSRRCLRRNRRTLARTVRRDSNLPRTSPSKGEQSANKMRSRSCGTAFLHKKWAIFL